MRKNTKRRNHTFSHNRMRRAQSLLNTLPFLLLDACMCRFDEDEDDIYLEYDPYEKVCPECFGSGYDPYDGGQCYRCAGEGTVPRNPFF